MTDPARRIWLWHAGPAAVPDDVLLGWLDAPLTDPEAAAEAAGNLARLIGAASAVHSSDLKRARQAARPLARALGATLRVTSALREVHHGAWEGLTWTAARERDPEPFARQQADWRTHAMPEGESFADMEARVRAWWATLPEAGNVVVVAHAGPLRALAAMLCGWDDAQLLAMTLARGHFACLAPDADRPVQWNVHPLSALATRD
ncbi:MAG: histidine phosphatase family protein [Myxococcales bacterium]|nr:histidine phosphatase family protein [Myxococcales bacterium]